MRLWHEDLLSLLPREQLLGQHRECCALRGKGWGKKHSVVDYVFTYSPYKLFLYHSLVMEQMSKRGYKADPLWLDPFYRGKSCKAYEHIKELPRTFPIYSEHDEAYKLECLENLAQKGIKL